jgi:hypothetical protein
MPGWLEVGEMNSYQPLTHIVWGALGLTTLGLGLLVLLESGKTKVVFGRVSGRLLLLASPGCLVFGFYQLYLDEVGGFFLLVAVALCLLGWAFSLGARAKKIRGAEVWSTHPQHPEVQLASPQRHRRLV